MPNHILNEVRIHSATIADVSNLILDNTGRIDFGILLPVPKNYWLGSVSTKHEANFQGNALNWCRENWGTKWGAYGIDEDGKYVSVKKDDGDVVLIFQTAWNTPRGWICALFNESQKDITVKWLDEGASDGCLETFKAAGDWGPEWNSFDIISESKEHKRLHKLMWGVEYFEEEETPKEGE